MNSIPNDEADAKDEKQQDKLCAMYERSTEALFLVDEFKDQYKHCRYTVTTRGTARVAKRTAKLVHMVLKYDLYVYWSTRADGSRYSVPSCSTKPQRWREGGDRITRYRLRQVSVFRVFSDSMRDVPLRADTPASIMAHMRAKNRLFSAMLFTDQRQYDEDWYFAVYGTTRARAEAAFSQSLDGSIDDHFATLGLTPGATADEIKTAYKRMAQTHHPDKGGDAAEFVKIKSAYEQLAIGAG